MIGVSKGELKMAQEKLFTLYHGNENDKEIVADNIKDWKQLWEEISEFLRSKNLKSYYDGGWRVKDILGVDYGSWADYLMVDAEILDTAEDITLLKKLKRSE